MKEPTVTFTPLELRYPKKYVCKKGHETDVGDGTSLSFALSIDAPDKPTLYPCIFCLYELFEPYATEPMK